MPDYTFLKINIWYAINTQALDVDYQCKTFGKTKNLHIVSEFWPLKVLTTTYCVICMSSFESCLCLKAPREFLRVKPPQWAEKTTKYRHFRTFPSAKNWKKFQSGVRYKCSSYSSVVVGDWQIALYAGDTALLIVRNAESVGVREGKTSVNWGFYAPKKHFYGCDGSSWVYVWLHREEMYRDHGDYHIAVSGLGEDNIIWDFIPVLEITSRMWEWWW